MRFLGKKIFFSFVFLIFSAIFWQAKRPVSNEELVSRHYEKLKRLGRPYLVDFFKRFPKGADLHIHFLGAIYPNVWLAEAEKRGLFYSPESLEISERQKNGFLPISDAKSNFDWIRFYDLLALRQNKTHDGFFSSVLFRKKLMSLLPIEECFPSILEESLADGARYLELMIGDPLFPSAFDRNFDRNNFAEAKRILARPVQEFVENAKRFLDDCDRCAREKLQVNDSVYHPASPICVRWIFEISRGPVDLQKFYFQLFAALTLTQEDERAASINIAGLEDSPNAVNHFDEHLRIINELSQRFSKKINLHAGEMDVHSSLGSVVLRKRISTVLNKAVAIKRLGHCHSLFWDCNEDAFRDIRERNLTIEVCPKSGEYICGLSGKDHPLHYFLSHKLPVVICTDDAGINLSCLTEEYVSVAMWAPYLNYRDFKRFAVCSLEASYLRGEGIYDKTGDGYRLKALFRDLQENEEKRAYILNNEKAYVEYRHALEMEAFERYIVEVQQNVGVQ